MTRKFIRNAAIGVAAAVAITAPVTLPSALAAPASSSSDSPVLKSGSTGSSVSELQKLLNARTGSRLAVDGRFGPLTKQAVISLQKSKGLTPDGIVGPLTWKALGKGGGASHDTDSGHDQIDGNDCYGHDPNAGLNARQKTNARTIIGVAKGAGVNERGQAVALATAMQESKLCNLNFGDRDSVGLFQQRPVSGWGTPTQITNTMKSSKAFFGVADHTSNRGLKDIKGWEKMSINDAAQAVQNSGVPDGYRKWESLAQQTVKQNADTPAIK